MDNMNNLEEFYGIVAEDLDIDNNSWFVKINPIEKVPNTDGIGNSQSNNNVKSKEGDWWLQPLESPAKSQLH